MYRDATIDSMELNMDTELCFSPFKGAVYFPSRAYNAYQTFKYYDSEETDRDFSYAEDAGLKALRIFLSYEQYLKDKNAFFKVTSDILARADAHGLKVMFVAFEHCGRDFTNENAEDRNPMTAVCVRSPSISTVMDPASWEPCREYIRSFMRRYACDERLIAVEVMNEPDFADMPFALNMLETAHDMKKSVPLTIGCIGLDECLLYGDLIDIMQFHDNFPTDISSFERKLSLGAMIKMRTGKPVWISEWQRLRPSGPGWHVGSIPEEEKGPALSTLMPSIEKSGLGSFFWSLMVKPAYLDAQRPNGTFNGLFHEDGVPASASDYQAISEKHSVHERYEIPEWFRKDLKGERK